MADERRLERLGLQWGAIGLIAVLYVALDWLVTAIDELQVLVVREGGGELKDRMSQLKPVAFKFPWTGVWMVLAAVTAVAVVGWLAVRGVREAIHPEDAPPQLPSSGSVE
jgi:hypothetical protein